MLTDVQLAQITDGIAGLTTLIGPVFLSIVSVMVAVYGFKLIRNIMAGRA